MGGEGEEADTDFEKMASKFVGGGLHVVLAVVRPGGWGQCGRRSGRPSPSECRGKASGKTNRRGGTGCCHSVRAGERGVRAKEGPSKSAERLARVPDPAVSGRPDGHLDARWSLTVGSQGREDAGERIGRRTIEDVVELGIAADRKKVRAQPQIGCPSAFLVGGKESVVRETFDRGIGKVGCDLRGNGGGKFRRDTAEETHGLGVRGKNERDGAAGGIRLVDGGKDLFHVLRTPLVLGRHAEGEQHGARIAE